MKRYFIILLSFLLMVIFTTFLAQAATEEEKQAAIDAGLEWLASIQQSDGRWEYGSDIGYDIACTGAVLLAFLEENYQAGTNVVFNGTDYGDVVGEGLNYLFSKAQLVPIVNQPAGDPDSDGDGFGVKFNKGGSISRDIYATGLVLPTIASTGTPGLTVSVGDLTGWTYQRVVQNTVDYLVFAQNEGVVGIRGGWRYWANYGNSDNSTSQWPVVAMLFASQMGITPPAFVQTELDYWIEYIQNGDGGSDYPTGKGWGSNMSRTGTLALQMDFSDWDTAPKSGTAHGLFGTYQGALNSALNYISNQWQAIPSGTWNGNFGHPYAMWAVYKGLEVTIGLYDVIYITNLRNQASLRGGAGAPLDPGDNWTWWEDYCEFLVWSQNTAGYWNGYGYWIGPLAAAWYINILAAIQIPDQIAVDVDIKPQSCPNPLNTKDRGVLPVAILGTEEFDVTTIDPASVKILENVAPLRWSLEDVATPVMNGENCECTTEGEDGYLDMTFKFKAQEVVEALGEVIDGQVISVPLTGNLLEEFGGTPIEGSDCIVILYKLKQTDQLLAGSGLLKPNVFKLYTNYPSPFNQSTTIRYSITEESKVELNIFNTLGQKVAELVNKTMPAGEYQVQWQPQNLPSGMYIISFDAGNYHQVQKTMYMK